MPPEGYVPYYDEYPSSASTTPSPDDARYDYYVPAQHQYHTSGSSPNARPTSKRQHVRTASYAPPKIAGWHSPAGFPSSPIFYKVVPNHHTPPAAGYEHVSYYDSGRTKTSARRFSSSGQPSGRRDDNGNRNGNPKRRASTRSQTQPIYVDVAGEAYDPEPEYTYVEPRTTTARTTRTTRHYQTRPSRKADNYFFFNQQMPVYEQPVESQPIRSRARRSSTTTRPKSSPTKPAKATKSPREATAADATRCHIPPGYSLKNWDPTDEPVLLLGSVFDSNTLGKWIYDWTVYVHGPLAPISEVAGELWLLMIKFSGKMKRAEECIKRIRSPHNREMISDFCESGNRIWSKLRALLKLCEEFMWRAAKRQGSRGAVTMGEQSGVEFVKSIFGRDRELETTEKLMQCIRLWNMRFDVNCESILKKPSAA